MLKKNKQICQGNCICFKLQITILNSYHANDILTFSKQHPSHALPYNWKHHQIQTYFSIDQPKSSQRKMSFSYLKIVFLFFFIFFFYVNGTFIPPAPLHNHRRRKGMFLGKVCGAYCPNYSLWNSDKEQLVDKEGPVSTKKYISK